MSSALTLSGVHKHYGGPPVVQGIDLDVEAGSTVALIGPNGAGKTTLFSVMSGERPPSAGTVSLFGHDVTRRGAQRLARHGVARTFQIARYFSTMTVEENVTVAAFATGAGHRAFWSGPPRADQRVRDAMEAVALHELSHARADTLSQGNRKNLEIAMALVQQPRILLLDEPTAGMGAEDIPRTIEILQRLRRERPELACVITAHDMDVVFAVADRVVLMAAGRIALDGTPDEVRDDPKTREIYLGNSYSGEGS